MNAPRPSRRAFIKGAAAGVVLGAGGALIEHDAAHRDGRPAERLDDRVPFFGPHQAGIETTPPSHLLLTAFDMTSPSVVAVAHLLEIWTTAAAALTSGGAIADDSGETLGLSPGRLTLTFGFGPGLFDDRFGLAPDRPGGFAPLPAFSTDRLDDSISHGDLMVQACAESPVTTFHATRQLERLALGTASLRWQQAGFGPAGVDHDAATPRNLLGFKDGTANPAPGTRVFDETVWVPDGGTPRWLAGGTYLCVRRIRTDLSAWDGLTVADQQVVIGRTKDAGAPLSGGTEFSPLRFDATGAAAIPKDSHVRLASAQYNGGATMLRRGYSYDNGFDQTGRTHDVGLLFLAYVRDIAKQFVPIQRRLASHDRLDAFTTAIGSATFVVPPGVEAGGYVGDGLLRRVAR